MKVNVELLHDSHNTDTTESISVQVQNGAAPVYLRQVLFTLPDGRQLSVKLQDLQYALNQPIS